MSRLILSLLVSVVLALFSNCPRIATADFGTVVSGTVTAIDPIHSIMRVHVTAVNYEPIYGSPQVNYVDYLVIAQTVVVGANNQFVNQSNILPGSLIQMQFLGPIATTVLIVGHDSTVVGHGSPTGNLGILETMIVQANVTNQVTPIQGNSYGGNQSHSTRVANGLAHTPIDGRPLPSNSSFQRSMTLPGRNYRARRQIIMVK